MDINFSMKLKIKRGTQNQETSKEPNFQMSGLQTPLLFENWKGQHPSTDAGSAITIWKLEHYEIRIIFTDGISD